MEILCSKETEVCDRIKPRKCYEKILVLVLITKERERERESLCVEKGKDSSLRNATLKCTCLHVFRLGFVVYLVAHVSNKPDNYNLFIEMV
jgi:hypothetical protein